MRTEYRQSNQKLLIFNKFDLGISLFLFVLGIFLLPKTAYLSTITPEKIIELTNNERERAGVHRVEENVYLKEAALRKAESILEEQIFDHSINGRRFSSWIKDVGYRYSYVGENLAIDFITSEGVVKAWLESEKHKKNLLNDEYAQIGVATIEGIFEGSPTIVIAQIFGTPAKIIVPAEIAKRNEQLSPLKQMVLSEDEHYREALPLEKAPLTLKAKSYLYSQKASSTVGIITIASSVFLALALTYLYIFSLGYIAQNLPHKKG